MARFEFTPSLETVTRLLNYLDEGYFSEVVMQNNKSFTVWKDHCSLALRWVIECENQPRDMPIFGVFWKPCPTERSSDGN